MTAVTPGQAARDHAAEEVTREFTGWAEAQGYDDSEMYSFAEMDEAFAAGMQAARDLAAQDARPAPGRVGVPESLGIPASHYCDSGNCDVCGDGTGDEPREPAPGLLTSGPSLAHLDQPQPAPGLAAAMAETRKLRDWLDDFTRDVIDYSPVLRIAKTAAALRKKAGLPE